LPREVDTGAEQPLAFVSIKVTTELDVESLTRYLIKGSKQDRRWKKFPPTERELRFNPQSTTSSFSALRGFIALIVEDGQIYPPIDWKNLSIDVVQPVFRVSIDTLTFLVLRQGINILEQSTVKARREYAAKHRFTLFSPMVHELPLTSRNLV
jgi:hypothetical protein